MIRRADQTDESLDERDPEAIHIVLTRTDLAALASALNNLHREVEEWEVHSLTGVTPSQASSLLDAMVSILRETNWPN